MAPHPWRGALRLPEEIHQLRTFTTGAGGELQPYDSEEGQTCQTDWHHRIERCPCKSLKSPGLSNAGEDRQQLMGLQGEHAILAEDPACLQQQP